MAFIEHRANGLTYTRPFSVFFYVVQHNFFIYLNRFYPVYLLYRYRQAYLTFDLDLNFIFVFSQVGVDTHLLMHLGAIEKAIRYTT